MLLVYEIFTDRNDHNWILKILWTYLHLRSLHRVAVTFPKEPRHSLTTDLSVKVQTIQVGVVAIVIPPCAFIFHGTVTTTVIVIVTIFGGKWLSSMYTKGISSGTLKNDNNNTLNYSVPIFHMIWTTGFWFEYCCWLEKTKWPVKLYLFIHRVVNFVQVVLQAFKSQNVSYASSLFKLTHTNKVEQVVSLDLRLYRIVQYHYQSSSASFDVTSPLSMSAVFALNVRFPVSSHH